MGSSNGRSSCPASHPYVYCNGHYCCQSNREKHYKPQGAKCDGSIIQRNSLCCAGDKFTKCPKGVCSNNKKVNKTGNVNTLKSNEARVEDNVDYWGADIRNFRSGGLRDCYNHCKSQKGCVSFTMRKNDHLCWLKNRHNGAHRKTNKHNLISANMVGKGHKTGNANTLKSNEARVEDNVDYWGADIRNFRS